MGKDFYGFFEYGCSNFTQSILGIFRSSSFSRIKMQISLRRLSIIKRKEAHCPKLLHERINSNGNFTERK